MKKKVILCLILLLVPFLVNASDIDKLELKWSFTDKFYNFSGAYVTSDNVILKMGNTLISYKKTGSTGNTYTSSDSFDLLQVNDDEFILIFDDKLIRLDEDFKELNSVSFLGELSDYYLDEENLLIVTNYVNDNGKTIYLYSYDFKLNEKSKDSVDLFGNYSYLDSNGEKLSISDTYDNTYYIDDEYKFVPKNSFTDGSYFAYSDGAFYQYSSDRKLVKTINFEDSNVDLYKFKYYLLNDKVYVSSVSLKENTSKTGYYYYTIHLYLFDSGFNKLKESSLSNSLRSMSSYSPTNYYYGLYLNNSSVYLYDGNALYNKYYKVNEDLSLTEVSSSEAVPSTSSSSTSSMVIYSKINDMLYEAETDSDHQFSYVLDSENNYIVGVSFSKSDKIKNELWYLDNEFNVLFKKVVDDWNSIDTDLYPDYSSNYSCFDKYNNVVGSEYKKDYIVLAGNGANSSYVKIYDKKGNFIKDLSSDIENIHMSPLFLKASDNGIVVLLQEGFYTACPMGMEGGSVSSNYYYDNGLNRQLLYYDLPYNIFTAVDGKGTITVSKSSEFSGNEIQFEVKPEEGYELKEVKVTDADGNVVVFTNYKFTMPSADVTIEVVFVPENPDTSDIVFMLVLFIIGIFVILRIKAKKNIVWLS